MRTRRASLAVVALCLAVAIVGTVQCLLSAAAQSVSEADRMLAAVNAERRNRRRAPLTLDARLNRAAMAHARDLVRTGTFDHRGSDDSRVSDRVTRAGYHWSDIAENLAKTSTSSPAAVVAMWMRSRGHRENLLNRRCTQMGIAHNRDIWVLVLARPR